MRRRFTILLIIIISINLLSGCWSKKELSEISIASAIAIDKTEDGYIVTAQIINPSEIAGRTLTTRVAVSTYSTTADTIFEAIRKLTHLVPRKVYLGHMRLLIFSEDLAREGIGKSLDFLSRDHEVRTDFYIMVAKDAKAKDILNVLTPLEKIPASKLHYSLERAEKAWGSVRTMALDELIACLTSIGIEPVITGVTINGNVERGKNIKNVENVDVPTVLRIDQVGVFKEDKLIGWLDEKEGWGYNAIIGNVESSVISLPCKKGENLAVEVVSTESNIKGSIDEGVPKINIDFKVEANIGEVNCEIDLTKPETVLELEKSLANKSREFMISAIKKAQKGLESDIFGFGLVIYRSYPKEWNELKNNWDKEFIDLEVNVNVNANIKGMGTITDTYMNVIEKGDNSDER